MRLKRRSQFAPDGWLGTALVGTLAISQESPTSSNELDNKNRTYDFYCRSGAGPGSQVKRKLCARRA